MTTPAPKTKQINVRLTEAQVALLRQHCIRGSVSTQEAILAALSALIPGFHAAKPAALGAR